MPGKASHPALVWPRTDGEKSRWPQTSPPKANDWYFEEVPENDPKYQLYEHKAAEGIVRFLGLKIDGQCLNVDVLGSRRSKGETDKKSSN